jgi:hypothetical protein
MPDPVVLAQQQAEYKKLQAEYEARIKASNTSASS